MGRNRCGSGSSFWHHHHHHYHRRHYGGAGYGSYAWGTVSMRSAVPRHDYRNEESYGYTHSNRGILPPPSAVGVSNVDTSIVARKQTIYIPGNVEFSMCSFRETPNNPGHMQVHPGDSSTSCPAGEHSILRMSYYYQVDVFPLDHCGQQKGKFTMYANSKCIRCGQYFFVYYDPTLAFVNASAPVQVAHSVETSYASNANLVSSVSLPSPPNDLPRQGHDALPNCPPSPPRQELMSNDVSESTGTPLEYCCPISLEIMKDPVTLVETGCTYDRASIESWFAEGHNSCPSTGLQLSSRGLEPNNELRHTIQAWAGNHPSEWLDANNNDLPPSYSSLFATDQPTPGYSGAEEGHMDFSAPAANEPSAASSSSNGSSSEELIRYPVPAMFTNRTEANEKKVGKVLIKVSEEEAKDTKGHYSEPFTLPPADGNQKFSSVRWKIHLPPEVAALIGFNIRDGGVLYDTKCLADVRDGQVTSAEFARRFSSRYFLSMLKLFDSEGNLVAKGLPVFECLGIRTFTMEAVMLE